MTLKILMVAGWSGAWPYLPEMKEEFEKHGCRVDVFDIYDLGPFPFWAKAAYRIGFLRPWVERQLLKRRLAQLPTDYDGVDIHYVAPIYRHLVGELKRRGRRLVASIWGSDFLRADQGALMAVGEVFSSADSITTNNPEVLAKLKARYPEHVARMKIVPFGMRSLDVLKGLIEKEPLEAMRRRFGVPDGKTVVTLGYNATRQQQHDVMLESLSRLPPEQKAGVFALIPLTNPKAPDYVAQVRAMAERAGVEFGIVEGMLSLEDICRLRIASDICVNMQTTDSLSASLQEHLFAGSQLLVGAWLPYGLFESMDIPLRRAADARELTAQLSEVLAAPGARDLTPPHAQRIYAYSAWSSTIGQWMDLYR